MSTAEEFDVDGASGQPIRLPIGPGPATGYQWQLDLPEGVSRIEDTPPEPVESAQRLGASGGGYMQVRAPAGEHEIVARLARPWQPDQPVRTVRMRLHVR